jgi:hypothetical protein
MTAPTNSDDETTPARAVVVSDDCSTLAERFHKVTVSLRRATHVTEHGEPGTKTLCGRAWWFECDLGTDHYCEPCQAKLFLILSQNA